MELLNQIQSGEILEEKLAELSATNNVNLQKIFKFGEPKEMHTLN